MSLLEVDGAAQEGEGARILMFPTVNNGGAADPKGAAARGELRRLLEGAIDSLPGRFRLVLVARDVDGMSVEETSDVLGLGQDTVRTRLLRARRLLRTALEQRLGDPLREAFPFDGALLAADRGGDGPARLVRSDSALRMMRVSTSKPTALTPVTAVTRFLGSD